MRSDGDSRSLAALSVPLLLAFGLLLPAASWAADEAAPAAQSAPSAPGQTVRVSVSLDYPPYEFVTQDGRIQGFNVDVLRAVARSMGFALELRPMIWNEALEALRAGEIDALAGMLRSQEREAWVDFSTPLLNIEYSIFVPRGTRGIAGLADLEGRSVLVERNGLMHEFLKSAGMEADAVPVISEPEALRMLDAGGYAAALLPYQQGMQIAEQFGLGGVEPSGPPIHSTGFCFAVLGGNAKLLARLDRGLADIRRTGEFQEIYNAYFGVGASRPGTPTALPPWALAAGVALALAALGALGLVLWRRPRGKAAPGGGAHHVGSYELIDKIGAGGMGEVWRARHLSLSRPAAIKLIRVEALQADGESVEHARVRFEREARATAALRSAHTIALYDYGETADGAVFYAMELLSGLDLQSLVERFGPLPADRAIHILRQVCESLEEAHGVGLLHRDIKPANVFTCQLGTTFDVVKVLDFGLVKLSEQSSSDSVALTRADVITGTPLCLAPEIVLGSADIDQRSDLYSLGCVAYWLLTGSVVFTADSAVSMAVSHATETPALPSVRLGRAVPPDLEAIVMSLLEKSPDARPVSAALLERRLAACVDAAGWTQDRAREWWRTRAPEIAESSSQIASSVLAESR